MNTIKILGIALLCIFSSTYFTFASIDKNLKYGQRDNEVTELQQFLIDKGLLKTTPSNFFGILTLKAIKNYQASLGISPTGFVGALTREKINKELETVVTNYVKPEKVTKNNTNTTTQAAGIISGSLPLTKTCTGGAVVPVNDYCLKMCPDGETIVETLSCKTAIQKAPEITTQNIQQPVSSMSVSFYNGSQSNAEYQIKNNSANLISISGLKIKIKKYPEASNYQVSLATEIEATINNSRSTKVPVVLDTNLFLKFENPYTLMPYSTDFINILIFTNNLNPCESVNFELSEITLLSNNVTVQGAPIQKLLQRPCN